ncbi:MAG: sugar transferase [Ilumatobacteraceae bacterium]|nr:sugar transferase [Ilumatobacteraceae bacterium]
MQRIESLWRAAVGSARTQVGRDSGGVSSNDPGRHGEREAPTRPIGDRSPRGRARRRRLLLALADATALVVSLCVALTWLGSPRPATPHGVAFEVAALVAAWMFALVTNRLYLARCVERALEETRRILVSGGVAMSAYLIACYLVGAEPASRAWVIGAYAVGSMGLVVERAIARFVFQRLRRRGKSVRRIAIVGSDAHAIALYRSAVDDPDAYDVVGVIGDGGSSGSVQVLGGYDRAVELLREHGCTGAIVSLASLTRSQVNSVVRSLTDAKMHVALATNMSDIDVHRLRAQQMDGEVMMYVEPTVRTGWRMVAKRTFDLVLSSVALLLCLPVLAVVAVVIKLDSAGPVLFRQERVGRNGVPFDMIKLRTMCVGAEAKLDELSESNEANGPMFKIKADPRITRSGRWLRRLSIDELPQFWNVLRGDMSLVGPRPALAHEVEAWDPELRKRLEVPPGLSGLWQVSGRSDTTFEQYRRLDLYYVDNWSLAHDLRVIVKTAWVVLAMKGAS